MKKRLWAVAAFALASWAAGAQAQHVHEGDIEIGAADGKIVLLGAAHQEAGTGRAILEGEWPDSSLISLRRYAVDEPGFDSMVGAFVADTEFNLSGWGSLSFWDGDSWESTIPGNATVTVAKFFDTFVFSGSGVTPAEGFFLGVAGPSGELHEHVNFILQAFPANTEPTHGAYRIGLQLSSPTLDASDPFYLVLNRGMAPEAFEESIHAMAVPEPESYALMLAGLGLLGWARRRRLG